MLPTWALQFESMKHTIIFGSGWSRASDNSLWYFQARWRNNRVTMKDVGVGNIQLPSTSFSIRDSSEHATQPCQGRRLPFWAVPSRTWFFYWNMKRHLHNPVKVS